VTVFDAERIPPLKGDFEVLKGDFEVLIEGYDPT
jgi:hypothetical protein